MNKKTILMDNLGYQFKNLDLLQEALSHRSHGKPHNERLEFLGDSLLNFVIASEIFKRLPDAPEGTLSRMRANLVNGDTLSELALDFELSDVILLGSGEMKSGGASRPSILADAVEAIIGAIYLDSDMQTCYQIVANWYQHRLENLSLDDVIKDPKSLLQELLQGQQLPLPKYRLLSTVGVEHAQRFLIECEIALLSHPVRGEGTSRRRAEQDAAATALKEIRREF